MMFQRNLLLVLAFAGTMASSASVQKEKQDEMMYFDPQHGPDEHGSQHRKLAEWCQDGTMDSSGDYCCGKCNGQCGGSGCSSLPGGASQCCKGRIEDSGVICSDSSQVACIIPQSDTEWCQQGTVDSSGDYCCGECNGQCGGSGCSSRPGGASQCCKGRIEDSGVICSDSSQVACIIQSGPAPSPGGGTCGGGSRGDGVCSDGTCCSEWGWCGTTSEHCSGSNPAPAPGPSPGSCGNGWKEASWTTYTSYAPCCQDSPNYDPNADTTECDLYSACSYTGDFAYIGHKSFDFVRTNNIIAFFSTHGDNASFGNKKMRVSTGDKTIEVLVADTCGDGDCGGCCTQNAGSSGYLVDMEYWTVVNNFGSASAAYGQVCWQLV